MLSDQPQFCQIHIAQNDAEHIVEVVCHAAGQTPDDLHFLCLCELGLELLPFFFRLFSFRNVPGYTDDFEGSAVFIPVEVNADLRPDTCAVFMP